MIRALVFQLFAIALSIICMADGDHVGETVWAAASVIIVALSGRRS